jgi:rRNA-processing protein CGR1
MGITKTWKRKEEQRQRHKLLLEKVRAVKAENGEKLRTIREKKIAKDERKKYNEMKSGSFQVIRNTTKLKKWNKKAKRLLTKLPPELFYEKFGKGD